MKVLVNGGLDLSELDGRWAEAYSPEGGRVIGERQEYNHDRTWDTSDGETLNGLLKGEIVPEFHARANRGIPRGWLLACGKALLG